MGADPRIGPLDREIANRSSSYYGTANDQFRIASSDVSNVASKGHVSPQLLLRLRSRPVLLRVDWRWNGPERLGVRSVSASCAVHSRKCPSVGCTDAGGPVGPISPVAVASHPVVYHALSVKRGGRAARGTRSVATWQRRCRRLQLQQSTSHRSLSTTMRYIHLAAEFKAEGIERSPNALRPSVTFASTCSEP